MKKNKKQKPINLKKEFKDNVFIVKWILLISAFLIIGGTFSFSMILLFRQIIKGSTGIEPLWIVGMIPMMTLLAVPLSLLIYRQVKNNISVLVASMEKVASGDLDTYIPTAGAKDFAKVYENFNKMVGEIQSAEILRTTMFDSLSHELKTPIASIGGFSKLLLEKQLPEEKQKKYLAIISEESERLSKLVKNILLLSKLDSQEIVSNKEPFSLTGQIQECIIGLENEWSKKNLLLTADLADVWYTTDAELIKIVWINLLNNAIKFTPQNGEINVSMTQDENNIIVKFTDTGIGMAKEVMEHIFERHYQADKSHNKSGGGLGLSIVKRIVKLCDGTVFAESKLNEGSVFTVVLPK